jgi:hypothetical protein
MVVMKKPLCRCIGSGACPRKPRKEIMNTTESTVVGNLAAKGADVLACLAWVAGVRAIREQQSRPIEGTSDPRYIALVEKFGASTVAALDATTLGGDYFLFCGASLLPAPPIDRPDWAKSHVLYLDDLPRTIGVEFQGKKWETYSGASDDAEASTQLIQIWYVALEDFDDEGGTQRTAGDVWAPGEPSIEFNYLEPGTPGHPPVVHQADLTIDGARALEVALGDVLAGVPFESVAQ